MTFFCSAGHAMDAELPDRAPETQNIKISAYSPIFMKTKTKVILIIDACGFDVVVDGKTRVRVGVNPHEMAGYDPVTDLRMRWHIAQFCKVPPDTLEISGIRFDRPSTNGGAK